MKVMILVAHVDDEVLGCGGYVPKLIKEGHEVHTVFLTDGKLHPPKEIDNKPDAIKASKELGIKEEHLHFIGLLNQEFDKYSIIEINKKIEALNLNPDMVITNSPDDVNNDHKIAYKCASIIARPIKKQIKFLTCEVLSSVEWGRKPFNSNYYVNIKDTLDTKLKAMSMYKNELREFPHPRSLEGIKIKAKQRGMEVGLEAAEAYNIIRWF
ncbi:MAG: PIG-L deacetylase family protein [Candidatus Undinarchaeales archaeon]